MFAWSKGTHLLNYLVTATNATTHSKHLSFRQRLWTRYYTAQSLTGPTALGKSCHALSLTSLHSVAQMSGGGGN